MSSSMRLLECFTIPSLNCLRECVSLQKNGAWALSRLVTSNSLKVQAVQMGALPGLLKLMRDDSSEGLQASVAEGVRVLMTGVVNGEGMEEVATARAKAVPSLIEILDGTPSPRVKDKLAAALEAFSPGGADKVKSVLEGVGPAA